MSWDRILGHDAIREQFATILQRGRLAHAYLFTGPDGIGKNLFATELAKSLLCEHPPEPMTACDRCASCALVTATTHPDLAYSGKPEGKNELTIDAIRELCATWKLKPSRGTRKIAIIEDADDFNEESANAFLKTLEEPPPGSLLILLATSLETQLATIRSRCQHIHFTPLSVDTLTSILQLHGVNDPERIPQLAQLAQGSAAIAIQLADDDVWQFRGSLLQLFATPRVSSVPVLELCAKFVEEAGKEAPKQRARATIIVRLFTELFAKSLQLSHGLSVSGTVSAHRNLAEKLGSDRIVELLEKCLESELLLSRYIQASLVIEALVDKITRALI